MSCFSSDIRVGKLEKESVVTKSLILLSTLCIIATTSTPEVLLVPEDYSRYQDALLRAEDGDTLSVHPLTMNDPTAYDTTAYGRKSVQVISRGLLPRPRQVQDADQRQTQSSRSLTSDMDYIRGDANADDEVALADAILILAYRYVPGSEDLPCMDAADADDNGEIVMSDAIYLLRYLYVPGSPQPPPPFSQCGEDPTPDTLQCIWFPSCYWMNQGQVNTRDSLFDAQGSFDICQDGNPWVVWIGDEQEADDDAEIFYTRWNGSSWNPEGPVNGSDTLYDYRPAIAVADTEHAFVAWHRYSREVVPEQSDIYWSEWNGSAWTSPLPIRVSEDRDEHAPVLSAAGGEVWAVWYEAATVGARYYNVFATNWNGSGWNEPEQISPQGNNDNWWAYVEVDSTGKPHVVYCSSRTGGIYYTTYNDSSWIPPELISDTGSTEGYNPCIRVDCSGDLHVVWVGLHLFPVVDYDIYYSSSPDGLSWSPPRIVNEDDDVNDMGARMDLTSHTDIWVVWYKEYSLWDCELFVTHFDGFTWTDEFELTRGETITNITPSVRIDRGGNPWVIWTGLYDPNTQMEIFFNRARN